MPTEPGTVTLFEVQESTGETGISPSVSGRASDPRPRLPRARPVPEPPSGRHRLRRVDPGQDRSQAHPDPLTPAPSLDRQAQLSRAMGSAPIAVRPDPNRSWQAGRGEFRQSASYVGVNTSNQETNRAWTTHSYNVDTMSTTTTTIRVTKATRDLLAEQARERGISLSALLSQIARAGEREAIFAAERAATLADSEKPDLLAEDAEWASTLGDGLA